MLFARTTTRLGHVPVTELSAALYRPYSVLLGDIGGAKAFPWHTPSQFDIASMRFILAGTAPIGGRLTNGFDDQSTAGGIIRYTRLSRFSGGFDQARRS